MRRLDLFFDHVFREANAAFAAIGVPACFPWIGFPWEIRRQASRAPRETGGQPSRSRCWPRAGTGAAWGFPGVIAGQYRLVVEAAAQVATSVHVCNVTPLLVSDTAALAARIERERIEQRTSLVQSRETDSEDLTRKLPRVEAKGAAHRRVIDIDQLGV
jgi:hypothetical protein